MESDGSGGLGVSVRSELDRCQLLRAEPDDPDFTLDLRGDSGACEDSPRLGIWRFEVGSAAESDVESACRRAIASGRSSIAARLVAVGADGTSGSIVLREGRLPVVELSVSRTVRAVTDELARWPVEACRGVVATDDLEGPRGATGDDFGEPRERDMAAATWWSLALRLGGNGVRRAWRTLFHHDHWNIGVVDAPLEDLRPDDLREGVRWAREPPEHVFRADPFGLVVEGRPWVLFEEVDYRSGKGRIMAAVWSDDGRLLEQTVVCASQQHLSYPYLIRENGDIYCVPETSSAETVELHRATDFPSEWEVVTHLIEGREMLDSTLFRHEGRWWLFAADRVRGPRHVLTAWHAPSLQGPWQEHTRNPIKVDVRSGRPAGTPFRREGTLYRPAQDGARRYGGAVVINRVDVLTPGRFVEKAVHRIDPEPNGPYPDGLHTLSKLGPERTLVDGNRTRFSRHEFSRRLRGFLGL